MDTQSERLKQELFLTKILSIWAKPGDITTCDNCEGYALSKHMHTYDGSMGQETQLCPECDLPEKWSSHFSDKNHRRYYVYFDPADPSRRVKKWGHPTEGNPLYIKEDKGEVVSCKRKR